jgi:hypothetical protein
MQPALRVSPTPGNRAETEPHYRTRSLPMLADLGGPAQAACMGDPARFRHGKQFARLFGEGSMAFGDQCPSDRAGWAIVGREVTEVVR